MEIGLQEYQIEGDLIFAKEVMMQNRRKKTRRMKKIRSFLLVGLPVILIGGMGYFSLKGLSSANESAASGRFYNNSSYKDNDSDGGKKGGSAKGDTPVSAEGEKEITSNDNVKLDTTPDSLTVLVNKELRLPSDYIPEDLVMPNVDFSFSYYDEKKLLRKTAADALEELFDGAAQEGLSLKGVSGYRSYKRQYEIFTNNVKTRGMEHTLKYSAIPGYSEHQTGLAIDISTKSVNYRIDASFADTKEYEWLKDTAHLYGYIIRYPEDKTKVTGFSFEPWHIRYVGKALAKYLYDNDMCLEEYYKFEPSEDYTQCINYDNLEDYGINPDDVKVPTKAPVRISTSTPTPTPTPTPSLTPTPTEEPSATPTPTAEPTKKPGKGKPTTTATPTPTAKVTQTPEATPTEETTPTPDPTEENSDPGDGATGTDGATP
jgi:D-alanyl-D-alanine carboxypeptidase